MSEQIKTVAEIAEELKASADAWDQNARLMGNVTAGEISRLCRWCLAAKGATPPRLAPAGQETASGVYGPVLVPDPETGLPVNPGVAEVRELRAQVAALTEDRDIVYCQIAKLRCVLREIESVLTGGVR